MASFITFNNIKSTNQKIYAGNSVEKANRHDKEGATFLSYSARDYEFLPSIIGILENHGTAVYVENNDPVLPPVSSQETAEILRRNITLSSSLVVFVTPESIKDHWHSWLLGLADAKKDTSKIALFPATDKAYDQKWCEQDHLGLYDRIVWGHIKGKGNEWLVLNTIENSAISLRSWLNE